MQQKGKYIEPSSRKEITFSNFLFNTHKRLFATIIIGVIVEFTLFKLMYPFPDFFSDSYSYIFAAYAHLDVNIWPIGYSKFLLLFHGLTHSDKALVWFQYLFLELSAVYFFFSILYFYPVRTIARRFLIVFLFVNPLFLYLSNYVSSDALFTALSLCWITQLIWMIHRPKLYYILIQAVLLFLCFTIRYNAMYYPLIAAVALLFSKYGRIVKLAGMLLAPALILPFIIHSRQEAKAMTGTAQFPILGGWQWANNALYMREYIDVDSNSFPSPQAAALDRMARNYFLTTPPENRDLSPYVANFFIREKKSPLKQYLHTHYKITDEYSNVVAWGMASPVFAQYGLSLIKQHPVSFFRHYMLLNTKNYFLPPLEKLEVYNLGQENIWTLGQEWFSLPTNKVWSASIYLQGVVLLVFPLLFLLLNLFYIGCFVRLLYIRGFQDVRVDFSNAVILYSVFFLLNFMFSVFANIIVIRYQVFPMIVFFSIVVVMADTISRLHVSKARWAHQPIVNESKPSIYAAGN